MSERNSKKPYTGISRKHHSRSHPRSNDDVASIRKACAMGREREITQREKDLKHHSRTRPENNDDACLMHHCIRKRHSNNNNKQSFTKPHTRIIGCIARNVHHKSCSHKNECAWSKQERHSLYAYAYMHALHTHTHTHATYLCVELNGFHQQCKRGANTFGGNAAGRRLALDTSNSGCTKTVPYVRVCVCISECVCAYGCGCACVVQCKRKRCCYEIQQQCTRTRIEAYRQTGIHVQIQQ